MDFKIDEEFKNLIPALSPDEFQMLEENCKDYRIRDALVVGVFPGSDGAVLIDGHNRYEIARKNNLSFETKRIDFPSREDAIDWVIRNQLGRRNIPKYVRGELILKLKPRIAEQAKANQGTRTDISQNSVKSHDTQKELAKLAGVSHDTIHKVEVIAEKAPEETKQALRRGDVSINQVYTGIKAAEHEDKRQQAERELREAKKRHEDFTEAKTENIVSFTDAKQDKEDAKLITKDFCKYFYDKGYGIDLIHTMIEEKGIDFLLSGATTSDILELTNHLQRWQRSIIHIQRLITERKM